MKKTLLLPMLPSTCTLLLLVLSGTLSAATISDQEFQALKKRVGELEHLQKKQSLVHIAGYASASYLDVEDSEDSFGNLLFSPIFHYQFNDHILLESEIEFEDAEDGEAEVTLEYLTIDVVLNDYAVLVAGKFLSPIGQFRQNLHPSWINKLPSAPPGFGHGGAAPISETGVQLRGGFKAGGIKGNYAVYVGNGPELDVEVENEPLPSPTDTVALEIHDVENEGFSRDLNDSKVWGTRIAFLPMPKSEIGFSYLKGDADTAFTVLTATAEEDILTSADIQVFGSDFVVYKNGLVLRGEYLKQEVGKITVNTLETKAPEWETFYLQASHRFSGTPWETVLRYTDFDAPEDDEDQKQTAVGINYLFSENALLKLSYESNDGEKNSVSDRDRTWLQMAYGF